MHIRNVWCLLLLCSLACPGTGRIISNTAIRASPENVVQFLSQLIVNDFRQHHDTFIVQYRGISKQSHEQLEDIVDEVLQRSSGVVWHLGIVQNVQWSYKVEKLIIFVDSYESVSQLIDTGNLRSIFAFDVKCLIVLLPASEDTVEAVMRQIFQLLHWVFLLKVVIAVPYGLLGDGKELKFFTYFPYAAHECGSTRPLLLRSYMDVRQVESFSKLYQFRRLNLNACPLIVVVTPMPNFIKVIGNTDGIESLSGIDSEHLKVFAQSMNFTVKSIVVDEPGNVLENSSTGIFEKLQNRDANFSISGMSYFPRRLLIMSATQPYYQGSVFIALEVDTSNQPIDSTLRPYQWTVWLLLVALFSLRFICLRILKDYRCSYLPPTFRRFMTAMWLIAIFYYRTSYESVYYTFMQNPPAEPIPSTLQEMSWQGYKVIADLSTRGFFAYYVDYNDTMLPLDIPPDDAYDMVSAQQRIAIATKEEHFVSYMAEHPERRDGFVVMPQTLFVDHFCVYLPRNSYLQRMFDDVISQIAAAGLTEKYIQKYLGSIDRYLKSSTIRQQPIVSISLDHLKSVFIIYFIALAVALLVVCLERASKKSQRLRLLIELF